MNYWHYQKSLLSRNRDFLKSSDSNCPYIIRLGFNDSFIVYDVRIKNSSQVDFDFFGYSVISSHLNQKSAKAKIALLMKSV
jgi:hypothetical protein